jgi:outer membrane protein OmpA-like peptidoglycan-associated protein
MQRVKYLIVFGLFGFLSACTGNLDKLKEAQPTGGDFSSALAAEYKAFAESEMDLGHRFNSDYYAQKGLHALDGEHVLPEEVLPELPAAERNALSEARGQLMALLNDEMKRVTPERLARTQLLFDCWQHQLATRTGSQLVPCADEFFSTLQEVQVIADSFITGDETAQTVSFDRHSASLGKDALYTIERIVRRAKEFDRYKFRIDAQASQFAKDSISYDLAIKRMESIRKALVVRGVADEDIEILRGTSRNSDLAPVLLSSDEPRKPRSVDIILRTYSAGEKVE